MALTPSLGSVEGLFRKLERELYRAYHHRDRLHKADHFLNFCITAHAMRDHFCEHLGKVKQADRQPFHDLWNKEPLLVAAQEIANSTKHFTLRDRSSGARRVAKTKGVRFKTSTFADVYVTADGRLTRVVPRRGSNIVVVLSDNTQHELYSFMSAILSYWRASLLAIGIRVRRQPFARLLGKSPNSTPHSDALTSVPFDQSPLPRAGGRGR